MKLTNISKFNFTFKHVLLNFFVLPNCVKLALLKWQINRDISSAADVFIVAVAWQPAIELRWHVWLLITANDTLALWVMNVAITRGGHSPLPLPPSLPPSLPPIMSSLSHVCTMCVVSYTVWKHPFHQIAYVIHNIQRWYRCFPISVPLCGHVVCQLMIWVKVRMLGWSECDLFRDFCSSWAFI